MTPRTAAGHERDDSALRLAAEYALAFMNDPEGLAAVREEWRDRLRTALTALSPAWSKALADPALRADIEAGLLDVEAGRIRPWSEVKQRMDEAPSAPALDASEHVRRHDTHTPCCSIPADHAWVDPIRCLRDLETWPCAAMIEEGPSAPPALDVETLTEAIAEAMNHVPWPGERGSISFGGLTFAASARAIAAEYARLQEQDR